MWQLNDVVEYEEEHRSKNSAIMYCHRIERKMLFDLNTDKNKLSFQGYQKHRFLTLPNHFFCSITGKRFQ